MITREQVEELKRKAEGSTLICGSRGANHVMCCVPATVRFSNRGIPFYRCDECAQYVCARRTIWREVFDPTERTDVTINGKVLLELLAKWEEGENAG